MIKLLLLSLTINYITSEQILTIYPQKKRVMNSDEGGKIPLIVKPSEDVNEEIEFTFILFGVLLLSMMYLMKKFCQKFLQGQKREQKLNLIAY